MGFDCTPTRKDDVANPESPHGETLKSSSKEVGLVDPNGAGGEITRMDFHVESNGIETVDENISVHAAMTCDSGDKLAVKNFRKASTLKHWKR